MATRNGSNAAAKSRREGRKAVAPAGWSGRSGVVWWMVAGGIVAVTSTLAVLLTIAKPTSGQRISPINGPDINDLRATVGAGGYTAPPWPAPADATAAV